MLKNNSYTSLPQTPPPQNILYYYSNILKVLFSCTVTIFFFSELLRAQTNVDDHDPKFCSQNWATNATCSAVPPQFKAKGPQVCKTLRYPNKQTDLDTKDMSACFFLYVLLRFAFYNDTLKLCVDF